MAIDYIYGSLDDMVAPVEYNGSETSTAITTVDNDKRVIKVDVKNSPSGSGTQLYRHSIDIEIDTGSEETASVNFMITNNNSNQILTYNDFISLLQRESLKLDMSFTTSDGNGLLPVLCILYDSTGEPSEIKTIENEIPVVVFENAVFTSDIITVL